METIQNEQFFVCWLVDSFSHPNHIFYYSAIQNTNVVLYSYDWLCEVQNAICRNSVISGLQYKLCTLLNEETKLKQWRKVIQITEVLSTKNDHRPKNHRNILSCHTPTCYLWIDLMLKLSSIQYKSKGSITKQKKRNKEFTKNLKHIKSSCLSKNYKDLTLRTVT